MLRVKVIGKGGERMIMQTLLMKCRSLILALVVAVLLVPLNAGPAAAAIGDEPDIMETSRVDWDPLNDDPESSTGSTFGGPGGGGGGGAIAGNPWFCDFICPAPRSNPFPAPPMPALKNLPPMTSFFLRL
jgi:hypothetical protein